MGQTHGASTKRQKKKKPSKEQLLQEAVLKQQQKADGVGDAKVRQTPACLLHDLSLWRSIRSFVAVRLITLRPKACSVSLKYNVW